MSFQIAIKFTLGAGDIDFYDNESCQVVEMPEQNLIVHQAQQSAATVKLYDTQYKTWQVQITDDRYETQANILSIINEENEMTFYPHYQYATTSYKVILVPDEVRKVYTYGEREALIATTFNLLESSK